MIQSIHSKNAQHYLNVGLLKIVFLSGCIALILASTACSPQAPETPPAAETPQAPETPAEPQRVSAFGEYEGYSEARFSEWVNSSLYVEMRDGVKLAVDVTRPAVDGIAVDEKFPVVWTHSRYHRNPGALVKMMGAADEDIPEINSMTDARPDLQHLVKHGYVVAAVGVRGSGASYGVYEGLFSATETDDAAEIIDWLASQPWSTGNIGMYGGSYLGMTQYMAAAEHRPGLKAIFPIVAGLDMYDVLYPGGVYRRDMIDHWGDLTHKLDTEVEAPRVDADLEGLMRKEAIAEHAGNWDVSVEYPGHRYRNQSSERLDWESHGPSGVLADLQTSGVPAYHWNGWFDVFVSDTVLMYANYKGDQKMGLGPWAHAGVPNMEANQERGRIGTIEQHRWFDYWLKGIDNGVVDEAPIHYAVMVEPDAWEWESAEQWPPAATQTNYYFNAGPSGSVASVNDGLLSLETPAADEADEYTVNFETTTGSQSRWDNAVGAAPVMTYPDLAANDAKSLTYTTAPLTEDLRVTGHPLVTLFASLSTTDADFHVLLEEVDDTGYSHYVTEGVLRASHRVTSEAPWDNLGLPFQRSHQEDLDPVSPGEVFELSMDLHPTAIVFNTGHRIRVTIMGADADNTERAPVEEAPTIRLLRSETHPSRIVLPVVKQGS